VAVVTNIGAGDHLGLNYITTVEDLAVLKRVIVQNVAATGYAVLNATDPIVAAMARLPRQDHLFCQRPPPPRDGHAPRPGPPHRVCDGDSIVAAEGSWRETIHLRDVPITRNGKIGFQVENVMASGGRRLGRWPALADHSPRSGGLCERQRQRPGPLQPHGLPGATVIADYGHNPDAMRALVAAVMPARPAAAW
jgi:cyanophycin synthetase